MAAQAEPSVTVAEPPVIRHRALEMRVAARQSLGRAKQTHIRAIMQSVARVRSGPPQGPGRDHRQPADSSLTQLLQPLFAVEQPRPTAPSTGTEPKLVAVRSICSRELRRELEGSLVAIRRQVQAIHHQFQLARPAEAGPGASHLHLVPPSN
jgi:hypothetical protein